VADGGTWEWVWRPYLGVWLVGLAAVSVVVRRRRRGHRHAYGWLAGGLACVWIATDWPVGTLGAGYLLSAHTVQYLLLGLIAPLALLLGWRDPRRKGRHGGPFTRPLTGLLVFNVVLLATHWPTVIDGLMRYQVGSFAIDVAWMAGGLAFWSPVVANGDGDEISPAAQLGYLFVAAIFPTVPAAFLTFSPYPLYALYELAPRVGGLTAGTDQRIAGVAMKVACDVVLWTAMSVVFFRWASREERSERALASPS
jgi:putative membrane protein